MASKRSTDGTEGEADTEPEGQSAGSGLSASDESAFDRLLHEAARVSSSSRLLAPGTRLCDGRFVIRRRLGEGGMGVVFEALDGRSDSPVAIKTLSRVDAAGIYRMKNEFRSLAGVVHPYLVPLHELFADGDLWFFTMNLIEGVGFDQYLRSRDEGRLRTVLGQLCSGVQAIHDAGKLHRDLKPSNVLVAETARGPRLAILDFGLASEVSSPGATQTLERGVAGTPAYMAPEQARGQRATPASDWYAVGVMLFEVLAGRLPFEGASLEQLLAKHTKAAPLLRSLSPEAPAELAELCDGLLRTDPAARPVPKEIHSIVRSGVELRSGSSRPSPRASRGSTSDDTTDTDPPGAALPEAFVGRAREIGQLEMALADTNGGKPVFVMVAGPSGIGKTTFVEHFLSSANSRGDAVVLGGRCYQRESVPYKGFDGVVDALGRYLVRLPEAEAARLVPRQAQALSRVFPVLGRVGAIGSAPQRRGLPNDAVELRYRAFEALKELLAKLAEERPLILSIDDLQWSDRDSARLLKHLLTPPNPPMLLIVATYRDDESDAEGLVSVRQALAEPDAQHEVDVRAIELGALSPAESRRLAQQLLSPGERGRVELIAREGAGSPFLIGELARAAHESASPGDLQSAILARVQALPETRRAVLHALCVAPRPVPADLLSGVIQGADVPTELRALISARLARGVASKHDASPGRKQRFAPYHDRVRETVLEALPRQERTAWHRRYTAALEAAEPFDLDALVEHAISAGEHAKGGDYARRAARQAAAAFAFDRAVTLYETALSHLPLSAVERTELLVEQAQARTGSGRCGDAARTFLAAAGLDPVRRQELQRRAGEQFFINGDVKAGADAMRRALASVGVDYDAVAAAPVAPAYLALLERGFDFEPKGADALEPARLERLDTLSAAAFGATWLIDPAAALTIAYVREALEVGEPLHVARGRALLLTTVEALVDPPGARRRLPDVVAFLEQLDTPMTRAWVGLCRGAVTLWSGSDDLGLADLQRAEELLSAPENRGMVRELSVCRAGVGMGLGITQPARAVDHVVRWMRLADEAGDRFGRMHWRCSFGSVLHEAFGADRARAEIRLGLELARERDEGDSTTTTRNMHDRAVGHLAWLEAKEGNLEDALRLTLETLGLRRSRNWDGLIYRFGRCLSLLLFVSRGLGDRATLLAQVEQDVALLARSTTLIGEPIQYPLLAGCSEYLRAQLRAAAGRTEEARELLEVAAVAARSSPSATHPHFINWRLGDLVGGPRGARLCAEAQAALGALGQDTPGARALFLNRFED